MPLKVESDYNKKTDFKKVANSRKFKDLINQRKKFIIPLTIFFLTFYFALPIMTSYSTILNRTAIGDISWAWIFAFAQFVMTWVLCIVYVKRSAKFDKQIDEIIEEEIEGER
ncbi:DUF485 domain-containing protein [Oceanobacillus sp. 1P07AA]|uniref:DUF485 domain-containing protein n=1 Tax=Oceanobacillus sp. 1P07AA TaxID=3132293 RepID=UPI0039A52AC0